MQIASLLSASSLSTFPLTGGGGGRVQSHRLISTSFFSDCAAGEQGEDSGNTFGFEPITATTLFRPNIPAVNPHLYQQVCNFHLPNSSHTGGDGAAAEMSGLSFQLQCGLVRETVTLDIADASLKQLKQEAVKFVIKNVDGVGRTGRETTVNNSANS